MLDDVANLVLARACAVCDRPGDVLCTACWGAAVHLHEHRSRRPGLPRTMVATDYTGIAQQAIIAMKEHGVLAMVEPLGAWLALSIAGLCPPPWNLVTIPAHRASITSRGADTLARVVHRAGRCLLREGWPVTRLPILERVVDHSRQFGRSRADRLTGADGTLRAHPGTGTVIVVDDVVTTGATVGEATRALQAAGWTVRGIAAVSGTSGQAGEARLHPAHDRIDP